MKKKRKCETRFHQTKYEEEQDSQNYWGGSGHELAASDDGYYFAESDMLYFYDRATKKCVPVCDKADCQHKRGDTNCNAYFNGFHYFISQGIWYYDHALYVIGVENETSSNVCLYKISLDGSKRTKLGVLFKGDMKSGISLDMNLYCNYAYFSPDDYREGIKEHKLYRIQLTKGAKPEEIYSFKGKMYNLPKLEQVTENCISKLCFPVKKKNLKEI